MRENFLVRGEKMKKNQQQFCEGAIIIANAYTLQAVIGGS
jgi:hypothetical protein